MTQDSTNPGQPRPFEAAVDAAFASGDLAPSTDLPDGQPAAVAALRDLIALLREAPIDRPSNAVRSRAERLMDGQRDLASALKLWLQIARQVVMELVGPGAGEAGLVPSLAGFRGAAAPIRTYRALTEATPTAPALEAWLDLQVDSLPQGARLRGQVTCEGDDPAIIVHLVDTASGALLASEPIAADGTFVIGANAANVTIAIELDRQETALIVGAVALRT